MTETDFTQKIEEFERLCRERGLPVTIQRRLVLQAVLKSSMHPTADDVCVFVRKDLPQISRTTVYRVLDTLVELGVIRRVHHPGAAARFDGKTHRHHHLVCSKCYGVLDYESPVLDQLKVPTNVPQDFKIQDFSIQFIGVCSQCRESDA